MGLKAEQSQKQSTVVTQRLIQNLEVLQMSSLELEEYICNEATDNPVIDIDAFQLRELRSKEEWLRQFAACLRGVNEFPKRLYYTCNPGGPGHSYIKRLFIDRRFQAGENPDDYVFIPAKVTDNRALLKKQPDYLRQLEALPRRLRDAWLEGKWDVFQGQVFQEFTNDPAHYQDRRFTHVIAPFDIPREWPVYRSYDFGYAKPFSCGWWAVDYDGVIYRILELYGCTGEPDVGVRWTPEKQFAEIRRIEDTHPWLKGREIQGVADPAIWDTSRGESIYETALRHRVYFTRGDNRRIPGWMQLHYRMSFDEQGYPMLYVFSGCRAFIRTIPELLFDQTDAEDVDTRQEDHVADESRYFCMGDHRSTSADSRHSEVGCVAEEQVVGKIVWRVFPFSRFGGLQ